MGTCSGQHEKTGYFQVLLVVSVLATGCQPSQLAERTNNKSALHDIALVNSGFSDSITFYDTINTDELLGMIKEPKRVHYMGFFECDVGVTGLSSLDGFSKLRSVTLDTIRVPIGNSVFSALGRIGPLKSLVLKQTIYDRLELIDYISRSELSDLVLFDRDYGAGVRFTEDDGEKILAYIERMNINGKIYQRKPVASQENPNDSFWGHWHQQ